MRFETIIACLPLPLVPVMASGAALSHHGGLILDCTPPLFSKNRPRTIRAWKSSTGFPSRLPTTPTAPR